MAPAQIPLNALSRHVEPLRRELADAVGRVLASGHFVLGPAVAGFEADFASYCGVAHCIGVANGTDALELALKAVGVGAGARVAVCANAAMYGTSAVLACDARPVFVDVDAEDGCMDAASLAEAFAKDPSIAAVIVTHLYGRLAPMSAILAVTDAHGCPVVEDCAQAHGARLADGRRAGAIGAISAFSFYPTKNLGALGDGGAICTSDDALAIRARQLRQYGWGAKYRNDVAGGRNSRLDEIQAVILSAMLPRLDDWNARRRAICERYRAGIRHPEIAVPPAAAEDCVGHLYVVRCARRNALRAHLDGSGVQTDVHYPIPDHRQPCHGRRFEDVCLPVTEQLADEVLTLPCFPELTDAEVDRVIDACNRF